jgi:hypothetical protein
MPDYRAFMRPFLLALLLLATPALAREAPEWTYCDFGLDPKAGLGASKNWREAGMQTGIAAELYGGGRFGFGWLPQPRMEAAAACASALASPDLGPKDWARRTSLLQASAAHRIIAGDAAGALADLDAAAAAIPPGLDAAERARTLDVSLGLLRAVAMGAAGKPDEAARLAAAAADARPWSGQIQDIAAAVLKSLPGGEAKSNAIVDRRLKLDDSGREPRARVRQAQGDFAGALADWRLVRPTVTAPTTVTVPMPGVFVGNQPGWPVTMIDPARVGAAALAAAFAGDPATARSWLAEARAAAAAAAAPAAPIMPKGITGPAFPTIDKPAQDAEFGRQSALVEAAIAHQAGQTATAQTAVTALNDMRADPATVQAMARIMGTDASAQPAAAKVDPRLLFARLPRYEGPDAVGVTSSENPVSSMLFGAFASPKAPRRNSYSGSVGFFKDAGFKARPMKDGTGTTVTFLGDASSSFAVEEMTLLRAAELAVAAGKPRLLILDKRDYVRSSQMTINGSPSGSAVPSGFQTELDVIYTDALDDRTIAVADVIASLAPVYRPG